MKKNDCFEIRIEDMDQQGNGIGHIETAAGRRLAVFVKDTVPGDYARIRIIKIRKNLAFGRLEEVLEPSSDRTETVCPRARACGGCMLQQMDYPAQLKLKDKKVRECLQRIAGVQNADELMEPVQGMEEPWHFRNKMQFPVGIIGGEPALGFYAGRTHSLIPLEDCPIGHPVNRIILQVIKGWIRDCHIPVYDEETHTGLLRHVLTRVGFATKELMVCLVINGTRVPDADQLASRLEQALEGQACRLVSLMCNINREKTNRILGDRSLCLKGQPYISDRIGDLTFRISPQSFYQVNPVQTRRIYEKALEYAALTGKETVWDMYCGTGTISLFLSRKAQKVFGVEMIPEAIRDAEQNASINQIANTRFYTGKAEEVVPAWMQETRGLIPIDVVVVDPPRKGCDAKLLETLIQMAPKRLVYVSCDPATLARDVQYLEAHGMKLKKAQAFDAFCHSMHVETVALLENIHKEDLK